MGRNGPFGTSRMSSHHWTLQFGRYLQGAVEPISFSCRSSVPDRIFACCFCKYGDASTKQMASMLFANALKLDIVFKLVRNGHQSNRKSIRITLNTSSINVPLPGPTSINWTLGFLPCANHSAYSHTPTSSPKTWLISGDVTKSPFVPNWSWALLVWRV